MNVESWEGDKASGVAASGSIRQQRRFHFLARLETG
jgi:hypothetical protein